MKELILIADGIVFKLVWTKKNEDSYQADLELKIDNHETILLSEGTAMILAGFMMAEPG